MSERCPITLAIPTYNRSESVYSLVQAVLPQLLVDDELLVIDDGSEDNTADLLKTVSKVRLICHSSNQGMVKTWNACITSALRDWICLVHDDDIIAKDALNTIRIACREASRPALVAHRALATDIDNCFRFQVLDPGSYSVLNSLLIPSGVTVHKAIINSEGLFNERFIYSADIEYFARICRRYRLVIIENPTIVDYKYHGQNYQYKTWHEPDFFNQLEEIERLVMAYSELSPSLAEKWRQKRMNDYLIHMFLKTATIKDKILLQQIALRLFKRPGIRWTFRLKAFLAAMRLW